MSLLGERLEAWRPSKPTKKLKIIKFINKKDRILFIMGLIYRELNIEGDKSSKKLRTFFDSGADDSIIKESIAREICTIRRYKTVDDAPIYKVADGREIMPFGKCDFVTVIEEGGYKCRLDDRLYVVHDEDFSKDYDLSIGARTMQIHKIKLDFSEDKLDLSLCRKPRRIGTRIRIKNADKN